MKVSLRKTICGNNKEEVKEKVMDLVEAYREHDRIAEGYSGTWGSLYSDYPIDFRMEKHTEEEVEKIMDNMEVTDIVAVLVDDDGEESEEYETPEGSQLKAAEKPNGETVTYKQLKPRDIKPELEKGKLKFEVLAWAWS